MQSLHQIVAALPPKLDGIGDYTARLTAELAKHVRPTLWTATGTCDAIPGAKIYPLFECAQPASVRNLVPKIVECRPDWVVLQYMPFAYGRWGWNPYLPQAMRQIKRRSHGTRFALMMHEPFVPVDHWKNAVFTTWQRWQLWQLGRAADVAFFSIDPWRKRFARWFPKTSCVHLPVGSNIPSIPIAREAARERLGIRPTTTVLGYFGTTHPSRMPETVQAAVRASHDAGFDVTFLHIGPHRETFCRGLEGIPVVSEGILPADEVSRRFAAMDIYLVPFTDGISTRRTSLMTGLQHGVPIVGTQGHLTDSILAAEAGQAFLLADVREPKAFTAQVLSLLREPARRTALGEAGRELFVQEFTWERIAQRMLAAMREVSEKS